MENLTEQKFNITAVICGAGKGVRAGFEINKIFSVMPNGKKVIENAILPFDNCPRVDRLIITANGEDFEIMSQIAKTLTTPCEVVLGGSSRTQSVINALNKTNSTFVLIHDGARPFITETAVNRCIDALLEKGSAILCAPCSDTVITLDQNGLICDSSRNNKLLAQTPQCFNTQKIRFALSQVKENESFTDEAGVYAKYVEPPFPVINQKNNKKLTFAGDFGFEQNLKVGTGFDLHVLVKNRKLILGGVEIEHEKGLLGHSDADVLTHAVMDAILSALSLRDIGYHFSDKDQAFKDISSMILLERVLKMATDKGYKVNNLSCVIMAEKPKLSPFVKTITASLASALKISEENIGITCTTCEKIGIIGREEGIAVQVFCSLTPIK